MSVWTSRLRGTFRLEMPELFLTFFLQQKTVWTFLLKGNRPTHIVGLLVLPSSFKMRLFVVELPLEPHFLHFLRLPHSQPQP
jgi:hypothetical protein